MSVNKSEPRWPAWGHDDRWAWRFESIGPLCTATQDYLQRQSLPVISILDADLNLFKIVDNRILGHAGIFGWRPGFKGTYLRIEPVLQFEKRLSLEEAKKYVLDFVSRYPEVYESGIPLDELSSIVMAATSPEELFAEL